MEETGRAPRERLLDPVDRISEVLFGLIMAMTILGSLSVATAGREDARVALAGALGCNLAWGLVDAVMYLVRTLTQRSRARNLVGELLATDPARARTLLAQALPPEVAALAGDDGVEAMRQRLHAVPLPGGDLLKATDYVAAFGIFLLVVIATFPLAVPFLLTQDVALAMRGSRILALVMLFLCGAALGRHAGTRSPALTGLSLAIFGAALVLVVMALGG